MSNVFHTDAEVVRTLVSQHHRDLRREAAQAQVRRRLSRRRDAPLDPTR